MRAIIAKHVAACVAEIRAEVERQFAQALSGLASPVSARKPKRAARPRAKGSARPAKAERVVERAKPSPTATSSRRTCGCGPVGRHRRACSEAKPPRTVEQSPRVARAGNGSDSPRLAPSVDTVRAARFAAIEASAAKRNGAAT